MVARLRPPSRGLGRGRRFLLPPGTTELRRPRTGPLPQPGRTKDSSGHLPNPVPGPSPPRNNRAPRGMLSGNREERRDRAPPSPARVGPWGSVWPRRTGSPRAAPYLGAPRAGEASGGRRGPRTGPLAAGPSWAGAAAAAAGSPGLLAAAAAGAAAAQQAQFRSGNRRPQARPLRGPGPGPGSGPDQHLGPDRNRPTCSSSSSCGGHRRCARKRTPGEASQAGSRRRAHWGLMEEEGGGPLLGSSALRRSGRQLEHPPKPPHRSARPPRLPSAF